MNSQPNGWSQRAPASVADRRAEFEALIFEQLPLMHAVARRLTRSGADADDLVQDACLRAYRFFDRFERGTNFRAWVLRVLKNLFLNDRQRRQAEPEISSIDDAENAWERHVAQQPASALLGDPERALRQTLLAADLDAALRSLPVEFRMVVMLCLIEGFSYQEAADALEIPIGTVMSRLHRGRKALQAKLIVDAPAPERGA